MRTYQRLVIAKGKAELSSRNPAYPHNFIITDSSTGLLKIGSTGTRYNSLPAVGSGSQTFVPPSRSDDTPTESIPQEFVETESTVENVPVWPIKKTRKKKPILADDSEPTP